MCLAWLRMKPMTEPGYAVENRKLKQLKLNPFFEREREAIVVKGFVLASLC